MSPIRIIRITEGGSCNVGGCPRTAQRELRIEGATIIQTIRLCAAHLRLLRDVVDERTG